MQNEFSKAFNGHDEEMLPAAADEAVTEENKNLPDDVQEGGGEAAAIVIDIPEAVAEAETSTEANAAMAEEAAAEGEPVAEEMAEQMPEDEPLPAEEEMTPEDVQRQKSWEGRLKKREEELAAREAELSNQPSEPMIDDAEIESIKAQLSEDFGEELVQMITKLATHAAAKTSPGLDTSEVQEVKEVVAQAIMDVQGAFQSMHFGQIADAHADFQEIFQSEQFQEWLGTLPEEQQQAAMGVIEGGRAGQVVKLLNQYKDSLNQASSMSDAEDAAMGVSGSSPVTLPMRAPAAGNDEYKQAWDSM